MPTTEGYNGAYTGQQIDAAIAKANTALPAPDGGTPGQILSKTEDGQEWVDKPVMWVNFTSNGPNNFQADKTPSEIYQANMDGYAVYARIEQEPVLPLRLSYADRSVSMFTCVYVYSGSAKSFATTVLTMSTEGVSVNILRIPMNGTDGQILAKTADGTKWVDKPSADEIDFTSASGLTADNVQDAIEEVVSTSTTVTLTTSGWTGDAAPYTQQVACNIVKSDSAVVSVDAQTSGDLDANAEILNAWALVSQKDPLQGAGTMTFYATEKPTVNIPVKVGVA